MRQKSTGTERLREGEKGGREKDDPAKSTSRERVLT